jgi:hypothetical protein
MASWQPFLAMIPRVHFRLLRLLLQSNTLRVRTLSYSFLFQTSRWRLDSSHYAVEPSSPTTSFPRASSPVWPTASIVFVRTPRSFPDVTLARCGSQPCSFAGAGKLKGVSKRGGKGQGRLERLGRMGPGEGLRATTSTSGRSTQQRGERQTTRLTIPRRATDQSGKNGNGEATPLLETFSSSGLTSNQVLLLAQRRTKGATPRFDGRGRQDIL